MPAIVAGLTGHGGAHAGGPQQSETRGENGMTTPAGIEIVPAGHNRWQAVAGGVGLACLKWSSEHMVAYLADGTELGTLYRSDGRWQTAADGARYIAYTWRAYLPEPGGAEVARRASQVDALAALLAGTPADYVVTFDPRPVTGPGALAGLRRMTLADACEVLIMAARIPRTGRVVNAATLTGAPAHA